MRTSIYARVVISSLLLFSLVSPMSAAALSDGKKHFREGLRAEESEMWDKAVEEFALAVADNPKNPEFRLHLTRALFNASQMFMKKGEMAAKENDYQAAYIAFKRAYAFDPTNELAKSEMDRMVRLQQDVADPAAAGKNTDSGVKMIPTDYTGGSTGPLPQVP